MRSTHVLVMAKAPRPGAVKTRLAASLGDEIAAELAAMALLDTIEACAEAVGAQRCHLSLAGRLESAVLADRLTAALAGWDLRPQAGVTFQERLVRAHAAMPGPVLQVGMDTPQLTPADLLDAADVLTRADAVLGPAADGGWWLLGLQRPTEAACLRTVPMSTPHTRARTHAALTDRGLAVSTTHELRDVDLAADAAAVARSAPGTRFARAWWRVSAT